MPWQGSLVLSIQRQERSPSAPTMVRKELFKEVFLVNSKVSFDFDKTARADSIAADAFTKKGAHVIVYYFGDGEG